jgi:transcriptional regulator with XRE-family HTH domain
MSEIKNLRIKKGITQEKLATLSGVTTVTVNRAENSGKMRQSTYIKLLNTLNQLRDAPSNHIPSGMDMKVKYSGTEEDKLNNVIDLNNDEGNEIKNPIYEIENKVTSRILSAEEIDRKLEELKSRYDRKLITEKIYEEKMRELI